RVGRAGPRRGRRSPRRICVRSGSSQARRQPPGPRVPRSTAQALPVEARRCAVRRPSPPGGWQGGYAGPVRPFRAPTACASLLRFPVRCRSAKVRIRAKDGQAVAARGAPTCPSAAAMADCLHREPSLARTSSGGGDAHRGPGHRRRRQDDRHQAGRARTRGADGLAYGGQRARRRVGQGYGANASYGTHRDAAAFGEAVFNCTTGSASLEALEQAGRENLAGKILIDLANPLDFSQGVPPCLTVCNTDSLAERIQRAFPEARVVKALNTVNAGVMVDPSVVPGDHVLFVCGNDATSKVQVAVWLEQSFGWKRSNVIDLGDITAARATEMFVPLWMRLYGLLGTPYFNINVIGGRPGV